MLWILLGVVAGLVVPVQTVINTRLRESTGTPFSSSMISFAVGTATLLTAVLVLQRGNFGLSAAWGAPPWIWAGGLLGVVFLTGNILLFPRLGAVQTVVLPIAGQILMGLIIDHCGLFSSPVARLTWLRLLGALIVLAGVMLTVGRPRAQEAGWGLLPWQIAGFVGPDPWKVDTSGVSYAAWVSVADVSASKSSGARRLHQECRLRVL